MPVFYLDAPALAKRYKQEDGSDAVDFIFTREPGDRLVTSLLSAVELAGAVNRLKKRGIVGEPAGAEFVARLREDMTSLIEVVPIRDSLVAVAIEIAGRHGLRAADSIHLSTMMEIQQASAATQTGFMALISDISLLEAALKEGDTALNPSDAGAIDRLTRLLRS